MDFNLTEQQRDMIKSMREYGSEVFTVDNIRQWREDQGLPDDVVQEFARRYFSLPSSAGGSSPFSQSLLTQAMAIE